MNKINKFSFDPEIATAIKALAKLGTPLIAKKGDWKTVRDNGNAGWRAWAPLRPITRRTSGN